MATTTDSFDRADSATTLGTTDGGDSPQTWSTGNGSIWGISTNRAYAATLGTGTDSFAYVNLPGSSTVTVKIDTLPGAAAMGLLVRYSNPSNFFAFIVDGTAGNALTLIKVQAGVFSGVGTYGTVSAGDTLTVFSFNAGGTDYLELLHNGSFLADYASAFNVSATFAGLYTGSTTGRFDNFDGSFDSTTPVALTDYQFAIDGQTFGAGTEIHLDGTASIEGLGVPDAQTHDVAWNCRDGVFANPDYTQARIITIPVIIKGADEATGFSDLATLETAWVARTVDVPLSIGLPGWGTVVASGRPRGMKVDLHYARRGVVRALLRFDCPDPTLGFI